MTMVNGGDVQVEKRMLDILCLATERFVNYEVKGQARVDVEEESLRATKSFSLRKRKLDEYVSENPKDVASSSRLYPIEYKRRLVVPNEEAVREIEPPVSKRKPVRRGPFRREAPVKERPETPEWLINLMREENGFDEKFIFKKELTATDLAQQQNRLLIPLGKIVDTDFLNEEEMRIIMLHHHKKRDKGLDVIFVGPEGHKCELNFRRWDMKSSANYVLVSGWHNAVVDNELQKDQTIHLWSFHSPQGLYFALLLPDLAPAMAQALAPPPVPDPAPNMAPPPVPDPALTPVATPTQALTLVQVPTQAQTTPLVLGLASSSAGLITKRRRSPRVRVPRQGWDSRESDHESPTQFRALDIV